MTWIGFIPSTTSSDGDITGVTAGSGMTGGGTTGAVTLNLVGGDGITANANDMAITAAQTTITSVLNTSLVIGRDADNDIDFATDNQIIFRVGGGDNVIFKASGEIEATSLDISGDADIDGTMEADAITLGGVTVLAAVDEDNMASDSNTLVPTQQSVKAYVDANAGGSVSGNTFATDLKIGRDADNLIDFTTDNNIVIRANGENQLTLVDGALTPTTNAIVDLGTDALEFKDGYFDGTLEADAITIGGTNIVSGSVITSLGTLSTLSVDNITINGNEIISSNTNGNIDLDANGSGNVVFKGNGTRGAGQFILNCEANSHGITIKGPPHSASASYTLTLPNNDGDADQVLKTDGSGNLAWVAQTSPGGAGDMTQFYLEDDDGTEVTIDNNKEVKFIGSGITTNWTDTSTGNDGDPYDLTFTVDAAQTGITSVLNASLTVGRDAHNQIDFSTDNEIHFKTNNETPVIKMKASGEIEATKFDGALEGNADTATALATARNIGGQSFDGTGDIVLPGVNAEGNQNTSGRALHVYVADNESTNEENLITFVENGQTGTGGHGLEMDGHLTYNPSTGTVTSTIFKGNIDAVDGDFDGTLEVDNLTIGGAQGTDGQVLTSTGSGVGWEDAAGGSLSGNNFATDLKIGRDADNLIDFTTDNEITFRVSAGNGVVMKASGEIEATELDISGAIVMNSDQKLSFGHSSTNIEGITSGSKLGLAGQTDVLLRISNSTMIAIDNAKCEFSIPAIPATSDGVALGSGTKMWSDLFLASGGVVNFNNGDVTLTHSSNTLTVGGGNLDTNRQLNVTSSTHFEAKGDIVYLGGGSTTQGELCYLKSDGEWAAADADATGTAGGVLLALALGTDPDADGMLLRGMFTLDHDPGTIADELYVSTTAGDITGTAPSGSGDIVRVVGYCLDSTNGQIWFNPSNDFIVLA